MLQKVEGKSFSETMKKVITGALSALVLVTAIGGITPVNANDFTAPGVGNGIQQESVMHNKGGDHDMKMNKVTVNTSGKADTTVQLSKVMKVASQILVDDKPETANADSVKMSVTKIVASFGEDGSKNLMNGLRQMVMEMSQNSDAKVPANIMKVLNGSIDDIKTAEDLNAFELLINSYENPAANKNMEINGKAFKAAVSMNQGETTQHEINQKFAKYKADQVKVTAEAEQSSDMGMN